jgi:hypothetical protein
VSTRTITFQIEIYLNYLTHCTEIRFASFFSGGFITAIVVNPPERKLAKCTSVHYISEDLMLKTSKQTKYNIIITTSKKVYKNNSKKFEP